jgi:uncharacterized tellurite resistance protein B-like protein
VTLAGAVTRIAWSNFVEAWPVHKLYSRLWTVESDNIEDGYNVPIRHLHDKIDMIPIIKEFLRQFIEPSTQRTEAESEHDLQIATAVLLLEMMRMDDHIADEERAAIVTALRRQFSLDAAQFGTLIALAEQEARQATDYYQFTSLINKTCDATQKIRIVENLWRVALADGYLDAKELHLMRKIADLLYIGHADYISAKQRAREAAGVPPEHLPEKADVLGVEPDLAESTQSQLHFDGAIRQ